MLGISSPANGGIGLCLNAAPDVHELLELRAHMDQLEVKEEVEAHLHNTT